MMFDNTAQMGFDELDCLTPEARARRMLSRALDVDAFDEGVDEALSTKRKAQMVRHAACCLIHELNKAERDALRALLTAALKVRDEMPGPDEGRTALTYDVAWLFDVSFRDCSKSYAWTNSAEFDLPSDLMELLGSDHH